MAEYTAKRIAQMIREQHPVSIDGGKSTRPCTPRDFCILMRSTKAKAAAYRDALEAQGISAYAEEQSSYLKSREISLLLNILRIVDNPPLDTAMLSVLLSPMFLFTMEEVTALRLLAPKTSLYGRRSCTGLGKTPRRARSCWKACSSKRRSTFMTRSARCGCTQSAIRWRSSSAGFMTARTSSPSCGNIRMVNEKKPICACC